MQLQVVEKGQANLDAATCLVIPLFEDVEAAFGATVAESDTVALNSLSEQGRLAGKALTTRYLPTPSSPYGGILAIGLGAFEAFDAEVLRRAAGKACAHFSEHKHTHVVFDGTSGDALPVEAFVEGVALGQYTFDTYKKPKEDASPKVEELIVVLPSSEGIEEVRAGCERELLTCECANWARDLGNTPPMDMTPAILAAHAQSIAYDHGCDCTILGESEMEEAGLNGILAVSKGSSEPARLIVLHYTHPEADRTLAIIGKGVTFDTGGISLKPGLDMHEMKFDMCGAAAVLGGMKTICQMKPKVNVVCVVPTSENKTGPEAYVPGDIVTCYNGKTVEVLNTDAEGRMLLADALAYTEKNYEPDAMVDFATLTGACVVALGHYAAGLFTNNDELAGELELAAEASGERVWPLPLGADYAKLLEGPHSDLRNIGPKGEAGASVAACFLQEFVDHTAWAHIDIAGAAWGGKHIPYLDPMHATGFGVRLLSQWIVDGQD